MTVEQLSNILSVLPPENEVMIEYQPRANEYQTEAICVVRTSDNLTVILGVTELVILWLGRACKFFQKFWLLNFLQNFRVAFKQFYIIM